MTIELVVVINGFPGVGKLTVASHLCNLLPDATVFDNHLLIDVAARLYERDHEAYLPLRKALRAAVFDSLSTHKESSSRRQILIFTECQSDNQLGQEVMFEYLAFARHHAVGAKFVSIILECSTETNLERLVGQDRPEQGKTKLVDVEVLREMRGRAVIHRYGLVSGSGHENGNGEQGACTAEGVSYEWEIDSTGRTALEIADYIAQKIATLRHRASASLTT